MAATDIEILMTKTQQALETLRSPVQKSSKDLGVLGDELSRLRITTQVLSEAMERASVVDMSGMTSP
jgi:hypothetical protein